MFRRRLALGICGLLLVVGPLYIVSLPGGPLAAVAQNDSAACPALVDDALNILADGCMPTGRNEACYGHVQLEASLRAETVAFDAPADRVPLDALERLQTAALDPAEGTWGLALLRAQADLPETLPGENVTFLLLGDVDVLNEGSGEIVPPCTVSAASNANLRGGPGTNFGVVGGTTAGEELFVTGQNAAGDWLRLQADLARDLDLQRSGAERHL